MSSTFRGLSLRPYLLPSAVCHCLSSHRLHDNYTWKPRAPPKSRVPCKPRTACLPSLLVSSTPPSTICVSTTRSCRLPLLLSTISSGHEHYQSLEHLRSLEYHTTSNRVSTIPPRIAYSTFYHLCVDYLSSRRLLLISTSVRNTVCCSRYLQ